MDSTHNYIIFLLTLHRFLAIKEKYEKTIIDIYTIYSLLV